MSNQYFIFLSTSYEKESFMWTIHIQIKYFHNFRYITYITYFILNELFLYTNLSCVNHTRQIRPINYHIYIYFFPFSIIIFAVCFYFSRQLCFRSTSFNKNNNNIQNYWYLQYKQQGIICYRSTVHYEDAYFSYIDT